MNKLNICVSHTATMSTLTALGVNHDKPVKEWKDDMAKILEVINARVDILVYSCDCICMYAGRSYQNCQ